MFKSGRWKGQNNKIKVMFQLQFQATQVPKVKGKGLMIALIPEDTGKPVAKLEKVPIVDGTCTWKEPVYEMIKLVKHQKTETYKEKIYYFNVQTGSSKSGFVGEVGVDLANFADITEPVQLTLPLTTSNTGAILHVFIQKMHRTGELRVFEDNESLLSESFRSQIQASDCIENGSSNPVDKKGGENLAKQRSITDWSLGSLSGRSMADMVNSPDQHYTEASKNVHVLKSEVSRLERQAELSELELESLRKQILKENKRSQDLLRKMDELSEEKEALETECDDIKEELEYEKNLNKKLVIKVEDFDREMEGKKSEISHLSENINDLYAQLEVERKEKEELKIHIEDISLDYNFLLQENDDMSSKSLTTTDEHELQVKRLEEKIMNQALEISRLLDTNAESETHIMGLEKELEKQGLDFEDDVKDLMEVKIEQGERIIQAEEALRKSTLTHKQEVQKLYNQIHQQTERIKQVSLELEGYKKHGENNFELKEFNSLKKESTSWKSLMGEKNVMIRTLKKVNNDGRCSKREISTHICNCNGEQKLNKLMSEISSLDERNKHMECELKEMQEKYSEVSLRFAEVESERQQLVMALRNLQNGKKK
ncbi:hypothetical protein L1987_52902 [Smallanthus sonchifolius]|uniref:Uncharacterized protein n=1 Tax=Smallanthus sonchifolius TaxID=185202 RepID=A0ACB9EUE4_9ASTR|nr:hypothetical protein L1987_52902 [Smallanthus sonchifolius]